MFYEEKDMKMTYVIMVNGDVLGKVYEHPTLGRTICFEGSVEIDDSIQVWEMRDDGNHVKVTERLLLEFFRDMIPL